MQLEALHSAVNFALRILDNAGVSSKKLEVNERNAYTKDQLLSFVRYKLEETRDIVGGLKEHTP